jgi:GAF domain-containing protein
VNWLRDRFIGAINKWVEGLILVALGALAFMVWKLSGSDVSLPAWALACFVAVPLVAALLLLRARPRKETVEDLEGQMSLINAYAEHLNDVLLTFQKIFTGALAESTPNELVDVGILQPARDFLMQREGEDVRLSVLVPEGSDFKMWFAAGHSLESKHKYSLPISDSFSRLAYETGDIYWSDDVDKDPRFKPHPLARKGREWKSIISVPITCADKIVAVLNVVSTFEDAFPEVDFIYVQLLGSLLGVVWSLVEGGESAPEEGTET